MKVDISSGNGLVLSGNKAITWANANQVLRRLTASKRPSELKGIQTQSETFSEADILHDEIKGIVRYSVKNPGILCPDISYQSHELLFRNFD